MDGQIFKFAQNNVVLAGQRNGITGDVRGFFNVQSPGITFAVTGPWRHGAL